MLKYYECLGYAMAKASKTHGMTTEWDKFQPEFQKHLDLWKKCGSAGGKLKTMMYVFNLIMNLS